MSEVPLYLSGIVVVPGSFQTQTPRPLFFETPSALLHASPLCFGFRVESVGSSNAQRNSDPHRVTAVCGFEFRDWGLGLRMWGLWLRTLRKLDRVTTRVNAVCDFDFRHRGVGLLFVVWCLGLV